MKGAPEKVGRLKGAPNFGGTFELKTRFFEVNPVECGAPSEGAPLAPNCHTKTRRLEERVLYICLSHLHSMVQMGHLPPGLRKTQGLDTKNVFLLCARRRCRE